MGDDVDLEKLPVPWLTKEEGGRYIGTWHLNVSKDPENGGRNIGVYRMQLLGKRKTAVSLSPGSHLGKHLAKAKKMGMALEMAVAIGVNESLVMAAGASFPFGADEYCIAGGITREAIALGRCSTIDVEIPAHAEIVIEGKIDPEVRIQDGPYLDYTGTLHSNPAAFVFDVSCLKFRDRPVFRGAAIGLPGGEDHFLFSLLSTAHCLDFHGSKLRQTLQNAFVRLECYRTYQFLGRVKPPVKGFFRKRTRQ